MQWSGKGKSTSRSETHCNITVPFCSFRKVKSCSDTVEQSTETTSSLRVHMTPKIKALQKGARLVSRLRRAGERSPRVFEIQTDCLLKYLTYLNTASISKSMQGNTFGNACADVLCSICFGHRCIERSVFLHQIEHGLTSTTCNCSFLRYP